MTNKRRRELIIAATALGLTTVGRTVQADSLTEDYPNKPVTIIVPFPPGGGADVVTRLIAKQLVEEFGQPFVVENRPGAQGNIGARTAARSAADGYVLLFAYMGTHAINPSLYKDMPFQPTDFSPVVWLSQVPQALVVNESLPVHSVQELIEYAKANPKQLSYSSAGTGSVPHLSAELFKMMASVDMLHIPYKGGAPAVLACASNEVAVTFAEPQNTLPHLETGRLRLLALTTKERSPAFPEVVTISESGLPDYDVRSWNGILAPAGTPTGIINKLNSGFNKILRSQETREHLESLSYEPVGRTPGEFQVFMDAEQEKWSQVVRSLDLKME